MQKRIVNELKNLQRISISDINKNRPFYFVSSSQLSHIKINKDVIFYCNIEGPEDSPFVNGIFKIAIKIPSSYPFNMPKIKFITPIYHPNLFSKDYFSIYTKYDWSPATNIESVLISIYSLMFEPDLKFSCNLSMNDDKIETEIINNFVNNYEKWREKAVKWTSMYAEQKIWSIFNHNTFIPDKQRPYIIYLLWIGSKLNIRYRGFIDLWILDIMPNIIGKMEATLQIQKYDQL